jgi:hypothetical protein
VTRARIVAALVVAAIVCLTCVGAVTAGKRAPPADVTVAVDGGREIGTLQTRLGTQFVWPGGLDRAQARSAFNALAPPLVRINATTVGYPDLPLVLPAGVRQGDWNFENLDSIVNDIRMSGGQIVLTVAYAPYWMWICPKGEIRDSTFREFASYMKRLVGYYNAGSFTAEDGRTITNPAGTSNRIGYWELWNEPDLPAEACLSSGHPNISVSQYVAMWNAATASMLAVDPTIKLVGPATANAVTRHIPDYLPALMAGAVRRPDIVSFHGYGGWLNTQSDDMLFAGDRTCCGLDTIERGIERVKERAPGTPIWITEMNVNSAWDRDDPAARPWKAFGAAWGASAFRRLALAGVSAVFQFKFVAPELLQFSLVDPSSGERLLPYWRDYYLSRYFPPGSALLGSSSTHADIEVLSARAPASSNVRVLVVNRRTNGPDTVGGPGSPVTVRINIANLTDVTAVTARVLDDTTPLDTGPLGHELPAGSAATVSYSGFGAILLEFVRGSPAVSGP